MSKLRTVIRHEYMTIVKQPSFWVAMVVLPLIFAGIFALNYFSNQSSSERIEELAKDLKNVAIVDHSGLIRPEIVQGAGLTLSGTAQQDALREDVRQQRKEALIVYPADLKASKKYQIFLSSDDFTKNGSVHSLGNTLLEASVFAPLGSPDLIMLAKDGASTDVTTYRDGRETAGINEYVVPGLFVVLFYIIFLFSIGYMLTSVSDEKENRSMEMVLTYVKPRHLIIGKLLAVTLVTFTQLVFFGVLAVVALVVARALGNELALPAGIDPALFVFDPLTIGFALAFVVVGFLLFAGIMTAVAAAAPSSKEANNFSAVFYIAPWVPFWFIMPILTDPENPVVRFLTYFPLTSPTVALVRNTVGNMSLLETSLALAVMIGFMVLAIAIAVRAFSLGALEFSNSITLSKLFKK